MSRSLVVLATTLAMVAANYSPIVDHEPETLNEVAAMLKNPHVFDVERPPSPPPTPHSPNWVKLEQTYSLLLNATCAKVLTAAPVVPDADAIAFMTEYTGFKNNGTTEQGVLTAAEKIFKSEAIVKFLSAPDSFQAGGDDANMVLCAVLFDSTPAGLAYFANESTTNEALVTQLLSNFTLMRDMLVAGGPDFTKEGAAYGPAMALYTEMMKASLVFAERPAECDFKPNCDYGHGSRDSGPATTQEECCSLCANRGSCAAGVWDGANCWFKTAADVSGGCQKSDRVKASCVPPSIKPGPAPAPPPPAPPAPAVGTCASFKSQSDCPAQCMWANGVCANQPAPPSVANPWDSRDQHTVLERTLLGTALGHAVPINSKWDGVVDGVAPIDAVARYLHYEKAYLDGDLDPAFEVLTTFEQRWTTASQPPDDDLAWMRKTMNNYRPDHVVWGDYNWRYSESVHTEVSYGDPVWPDGRPDYKDIAAAGGVCGPRAWFGRFCKRAFGLPTWGAAQPGHAAMTSWSPNGWNVQLGAAWGFCTWNGRGGSDFKLETSAREFQTEYQQYLRMSWVADARGDKKVSPDWNPAKGSSLGSGGLWNALGFYYKHISVKYTHNNTQPTRPIGPSVVPTKVADLIERWPVPVTKPKVNTLPDGTINIPAASFSWENRSMIKIMVSADEGYQVFTNGVAQHSAPDQIAWSYDVTLEADATMYLTANHTTWHMQTTLTVQVTTDAGTDPIAVPVYYTVGFWNETQPVALKLSKGLNTIKFSRGGSAELAFKEFFLYPTKPNIQPPPKNHTTAPPAPSPPVSDYIELPSGTDCVKQGIQDLTAAECGDAAYFFDFKDTGSRARPMNPGCFVITSGQYKGNANFNTNKSASCCDLTQRSICIRK